MRIREKLQIKLAETWFHSMSFVEKRLHGVSLNFFDGALRNDPYPMYNRLRDTAPIHYSLAARSWWVTGFDLVQEVLTDKRFGTDVRRYPKRLARILKYLNEEQRETFNNPSMLNRDPPDHSRLRRLVSQGFMHKFIQSLEPRIASIVDDCLRAHDNAAEFDVMESLAKPLPAIVIAEMMGLPQTDHAQFQTWSEDLIGSTQSSDLEKLERGRLANSSLINYFRGIIRDRRGNPGDDLIGQLIRAEEEGDKLTEQELYNTCLLLLVAGHETTTRLIGNGLYLLLKSPALWQKLQAEPELIPKAIEEMLRFEPPVQFTQRFATEDMDFHGKQLKQGDAILVGIAAANRDPAVNDNPDSFDFSREKVRQVSFGYGIHLCLGASLARLEAKVTFEKLLARYPHLTLAGDQPNWGTNPLFRGHEVLRVAAQG